MGRASRLKKKGGPPAPSKPPEAPGASNMEKPGGALTESMTRVRDEILAWRRNRQSLRSDLAASAQSIRQHVAALRLAMASDRAGARRAWCGSDGTGLMQKKP